MTVRPDRLAIVTGAAQGIGGACAERLARDGFVGYVRAMAAELGAFGITVNAWGQNRW